MSTTEQPEEMFILKTNPLINAFAKVCMVYGLLNDLGGDNKLSYTRRLEWLESQAQGLVRVTQKMIRQRKQEVLDNEL